MRCLLEQVAGVAKVGDSEKVNQMFGTAKKDNTLPSKLIVRDAYLTEESVAQLEACDALDMPYTENKFENTIDRVAGKAEFYNCTFLYDSPEKNVCIVVAPSGEVVFKNCTFKRMRSDAGLFLGGNNGYCGSSRKQQY